MSTWVQMLNPITSWGSLSELFNGSQPPDPACGAGTANPPRQGAQYVLPAGCCGGLWTGPAGDTEVPGQVPALAGLRVRRRQGVPAEEQAPPHSRLVSREAGS